MKKKCLVCVAMGSRYVLQTKKMIDTFLAHNQTWDVRTYFDGNLVRILPDQCRGWSDFNKCEIGRWFAMQDALNEYDTVVYSDGDMRWYDAYETSRHGMVLYPHYVTRASRQLGKHWIAKDGAANIGIIEMSKGSDNDGIFDFITGEVLHRPERFMHSGAQLWLQNLVSCIPDCGYDCVYNCHAGYNVASWNLKKGDREIIMQDGKYIVRTNEGKVFPLVSMHFSGKSLGTLEYMGEEVKVLLKEYLA